MSLFALLFCAGQLETPDAGVTYIMDVLEEVGSDVARRCYWDFGDWSDLWRETKRVPLDVTLLVSGLSLTAAVVQPEWRVSRTACTQCPACCFM
jgi:hypothetical protein